MGLLQEAIGFVDRNIIHMGFEPDEDYKKYQQLRDIIEAEQDDFRGQIARRNPLDPGSISLATQLEEALRHDQGSLAEVTRMQGYPERFVMEVRAHRALSTIINRLRRHPHLTSS